jgi:2-isopropylmalate synthase
MSQAAARRLDPDAHAEPDPAFALERWSATSGNRRPSRASLALRGAGQTWRASSEGNGGVDALMRAVDVALAPFLGEGVQLETFNVHAVGTGHDAAASVSLSIRPRAAHDHAPGYTGRGVHANVLEASVVAYVDAINRLLSHAGVDVAAVAAAVRPPRQRTRTVDPETRQRRLEPLMSLYNP